jgi:hypothetical protein
MVTSPQQVTYNAVQILFYEYSIFCYVTIRVNRIVPIFPKVLRTLYKRINKQTYKK